MQGGFNIFVDTFNCVGKRFVFRTKVKRNCLNCLMKLKKEKKNFNF